MEGFPSQNLVILLRKAFRKPKERSSGYCTVLFQRHGSSFSHGCVQGGQQYVAYRSSLCPPEGWSVTEEASDCGANSAEPCTPLRLYELI